MRGYPNFSAIYRWAFGGRRQTRHACFYCRTRPGETSRNSDRRAESLPPARCQRWGSSTPSPVRSPQVLPVRGHLSKREIGRKRLRSWIRKTTFFSNVSHELRTPLTLMLGPLEDALQNEMPPPPASLEMLHRNAIAATQTGEHAAGFLPHRGRPSPCTLPGDQHLVIATAELSSVFREAVDRAGLKLTVECLALPEPVYVDHEMWEKVILNLLSNALKSTFDGEIRVMLHRHRDRGRTSRYRYRNRNLGGRIYPVSLIDSAASRTSAGEATRAAVSGWHWCGSWCRCMADRLVRKAYPAREPHSP